MCVVYLYRCQVAYVVVAVIIEIHIFLILIFFKWHSFIRDTQHLYIVSI